MVFVPPEPSWNALLLVLNCGGGDAARRLADNRDSLSAIRDFIKFAPDWKALEVSLGTPQRREYKFCKPVYMTEFPGITAAIVVEYARFLRLFEGMPHKSIAPPPNWPTLLHDNPATPRGPPTSEVLKKIWEFHSKQDSYAEDCLLLTGREIPYYEYDDSPALDIMSVSSNNGGLVAYRRTYVRYEAAYGTPPSNVWPDSSALMALADECQNHLDDCEAEQDADLPCSREVGVNVCYFLEDLAECIRMGDSGGDY